MSERETIIRHAAALLCTAATAWAVLHLHPAPSVFTESTPPPEPPTAKDIVILLIYITIAVALVFYTGKIKSGGDMNGHH